LISKCCILARIKALDKNSYIALNKDLMTFPQSNPIKGDISFHLQALAANKKNCASIYLDTTENESSGGENHHQGLARTHKLKDGSIYFFLAHSNIGGGGKLMQFRYDGPTDNEHIETTKPLTVAPMQQKLFLLEEHPSDICFLPDIDNADAGYLFVTEENQMRRLAIFFWRQGEDLRQLGFITHEFTNVGEKSGPNFLFIDKYLDDYYLGIANAHDEECALYIACDKELFPADKIGCMNISAFRRSNADVTYSFPVQDSPSQVKLVRNERNEWWLLAFRSDPPDKENADDYVDAYPVSFSPVFQISPRQHSQHIFFPPGDTSFASTGTHYVESSGRLLVSSSYRWSEDEGPGRSSYVSRVDECPS
jgi:hypothetical protein